MNTQLFDALLEPTFLLNAEKKVVYCNEMAANLTDFSARKIMRAQPVFDQLLLFEVPLEGLASLSTVMEATPYQEVKFKNEGGRDGKAQITFQAFDIQDGVPQTWLVFFRDVTLEETLSKKYRGEIEQKEGYIRELEVARAKLEDYSKNLEKMVADRTAELSRLNQLMGALLDSLGQGFFIFNSEGKVLEISSKACEATIEKNPRGLDICQALGLPEQQHKGFKKWMVTLFSEMLPFEDLAPLGPPRYPHTQGKEIELQYYPLRTDSGVMEGVVVVATDITSLVQAQRDAEVERAHAKMILNLVKNKRQVASFIRESEEMLRELQLELQKSQPDPELSFRLLHTLKGGAATFSVKAFADHCHVAESLLTEWKSLQTPELLNKVKDQCVDLPQLFSEFLKNNEAILGSSNRLSERWVEAPLSKFENFRESHFPEPGPLRRDFTSEFFLEPVGPAFEPMNEVIQNVALRLGKEVEPLNFLNPDFPILPEPYETLLSTLIHAFRNAVDHGIEMPDVRMERGKSPKGQITVQFERKQNLLQIQISDDGNGVDPARIRQKFSEKGTPLDHETDDQVIQHIFDSQFSTREEVTDLSGRGVGMDAIARAAQQLGGRAWVDSKLGQGTRLWIEVPWIEELAGPSKRKSAA